MEVIELGPVAVPSSRAGGRAAFAGLVIVLVGLIGLARFPGHRETAPNSSIGPSASPPATTRTAPSATPYPWAWAGVELEGYGRGASVENLWVLGDRFVAEIETDEGPDGGPYGPVASVLLTSSDGLAWSDIDLDLPVEGFSIAAGAVADKRLWVLGSTGAADSARWQFWSTDDGSWRHEADPVGLVAGPARVTALAYHGGCMADADCPAAGWVAAIDSAASGEQLRTSGGGRSWRPVEVSGEAGFQMIGLTFHRDRWFAAGSATSGATVVLTSIDRVHWSSAVVATSGTSGRDIAAGVAGVVVVGLEEVQGDRRPRVWLSTDGESWIRMSGETPFGRAPAPMDHVTATDQGYLAITTATGDAWISTDGEHWRDLPAFEAGTGNAVKAIAAAGDVLVAAGHSSAGRPTFWAASLSDLLGVP